MTPTLSQPVDQAIRDEALDPTRSFIVEAPAGSGKTELLTRRFLRLLACVREPESVLAITFTRKAAAEMRNRILKALTLAEEEAPPKSSQQAIWELAREVRKVDQRFDWQLLAHPARLRIMTIDSLNSFLARQLPLLSGIGATLRISDDSQKLYAETVLRLIERLSARDDAAESVARLLRHLDNRYEVLERLLSKELSRREYWLDLGLMRFDVLRLRSALEAALRDAIVTELKLLPALIPGDAQSELLALIRHAAAVLNSVGVESPITACDDLSSLPEADCNALSLWRGIAGFLLTKEGGWRARVDKNTGFPPENKSHKQRMLDLLKRLQRESELAEVLHRVRELPNATYSDAQWQVLTDLLEVLKLAIVELEVVMRERAEGDYTANAIAARRALGSLEQPTDLALRLDYRLEHLLVDEFQDTSRGQIELLSLLTAGWSEGDGKTLFCVGDPMQSIYRFRHADVGLFLNLKVNGLNQLKLKPLRLAVNFRSAKPVMHWVNSAFENALPRRDDPHRGAVAFTSSEAQNAAADAGGVFVHPITGLRLDARVTEAKEIGALIARTRLQTPEAKVAILVSNRSHLQWVIRELRARSIPFNAVEIDPLVTRPAIQDLLALTRAFVHLADRTAWLALLRAPWCGLSLADLHQLCANADDEAERETIWQLLNNNARIERLSLDGQTRIAYVLPVLRIAIAIRGRIALRECIERAWLSLGGPATVESANALLDCDTYFARLQDIERNGDIEDIARLEESLRDLYAVDADVDENKVELMTVHRAKGLEFDVVILPALDSGSKGDDPPLLRTQGSSRIDDRALLLAPIAARGAEKEAIYSWLETQDKERARLEKGRLLYVASTRAIRELHLFGAVEAGGKPRPNTFLHLLWPLVESEFATESVIAAPASASANPNTLSIRTRRLPVIWQLPVPCDVVGSPKLRNVVDNEPLSPEFAWAGETARHVGTVVHREIDRLSRSADPHKEQASAARYRTALAELGVPPHLQQAAAERIGAALRAMLKDERGRWLLAGSELHREVASEFAVTGEVGGEIVNRVIDRTFIDRDGVRWIVDFKTSAHEGGGLDEFLANEVVRYRPQLQVYADLMRSLRPAEPVKAALYFPLLGAWREVALGNASS